MMLLKVLLLSLLVSQVLGVARITSYEGKNCKGKLKASDPSNVIDLVPDTELCQKYPGVGNEDMYFKFVSCDSERLDYKMYYSAGCGGMSFAYMSPIGCKEESDGSSRMTVCAVTNSSSSLSFSLLFIAVSLLCGLLFA